MPLKLTPPLDWRSTFTYLSPRVIPGLELVSGDAYARTLAFGWSKVLLRAAWAGNDAIFVELASDASIEPVRVTPTLRRMFDGLSRKTEVDMGGQVQRKQLAEGDRAPDFEFVTRDAKPLRSSDLLRQGPLLLTFYRGAWCMCCQSDLRDLMRAMPAIRETGSTVLGVFHDLGSEDKIWNVMRPLYPDVFLRATAEGVINPWMSVTLKRRVKKKKHAVTREEVYKFAWGCIEKGRPEPAAVAVICFEWLQRPENVVAGILTWPDYRSKKWLHAIRIEHHKTGALVWHPLEEVVDGEIVKFYGGAEKIISHLPKLGIPMIMRKIGNGEKKGEAKKWSYPGMERLVQTMRKQIGGVSSLFTLDACRHGGMTSAARKV
jgi:hypothetical protein